MDILTYINRMNQIYGNGAAPAPRYNTQQYLQGGRVGYQSGQLVDHGPGRQGYNGKVEGIELIESLKNKKDNLGRPFISDYKEKLKLLEELQKNKYLNPNTNKPFTPKEWLNPTKPDGSEYSKKSIASFRSKFRDPQAFLDKKATYQKKYTRKRKIEEPEWKEKLSTEKKDAYYSKERKKWTPSEEQSGRGVLREQRNKMLHYMSTAAQKGNTNYTEIIKDGKFLGVKDNATGINYYEEGYKGKLGSKSKLISSHPDFKNVQNLTKLADKFKRSLPNKAIQSYFSSYGRVPKMGELYNYLIADPRYVSKMGPKAFTDNPLQLHHKISMVDSPTQKFQLLLKDKNNQAGVLTDQFKKGIITKDKLNAGLKKINARVKAAGWYTGAKDITPEQQVKVAKMQTTKLFNKMLKENPKQLETITKLITSLCPNKASGGRVGMALAGSAGLECGKKQLQKHLIKGTGTQVERGTIAKIVQGGSNLMKGLSPKEILKLRNLIGPAALAFEAGIGAGMIGYDVLRKNIPIKEALGKNWLTGWAMPRSEKEYQIDDMRKQGLLLNPGAKTYAQGLELSARYERLADVLSKLEDPVAGYRKINPKIATELGVESIADIEKEMEKIMNEYNKLTREGTVMEEGSGAQLEFMQDFTEFEAKRATPNLFGELGAKEKISTTGEREGPRGMGVVQKEPVRIDQRQFDLPETYEKVSLSETPIDEKTMRDMRDVYRQYGILKPRDELPSEYVDYFQRKEKFNQAMKLPGMLGTQERFKSGGRVSFKFGSMGRRGFLKLLAALGIGTAGAKAGLLGLSKVAGKKAVSTAGVDIATGTPGMPSWFPALVNKIIKEGDDVTAKLATTDRQVVHTKKIPGGDEATVYRDLDTGNVTVEYGGPLMNKKGQIIRASNDPEIVHLEYRAGEVIEEGAMKGKKTKPEFSAAEAEPEVVNWDGDIEMSGINEVNKVEDLVTPTNKLQEFATGKNLNIRDRLKLERQQKYKKKLDTDTMEQVDYIEKKHPERPTSLEDYYDDSLPDIDDID